jgi:hypothetical protein
MDVHVPEAGNQEFPGGIDDAGARSGLHTCAYGSINGKNASAADGDGDVLACRRTGSVDDGRMFEDNILSRNNRKEGSESKQPVTQAILTCLFQFSYSVSD